MSPDESAATHALNKWASAGPGREWKIMLPPELGVDLYGVEIYDGRRWHEIKWAQTMVDAARKAMCAFMRDD